MFPVASEVRVGASPVSSPASGGKSLVGRWLPAIVGYAIGWFAIKALPTAMKAKVIGGCLAGLLVGLVPFYIAKRNGHDKLAGHALGWTIVAGAAFGILLAAPVATVFVIVALRRTRAPA